MGLDVYLYKCKDRSIGERAAAAYEVATKPLWGVLPDAKLDRVGYDAGLARIEQVAADLGCDKWGTYTGPGAEVRVNKDAKDPRFPGHICDLGYLRSSYNSGGYNSVAEQRGWPTFYDIFGAGDDYIVKPDWDQSLAVVDAALANIKPDDSKYFVVELRGTVHADCAATSEREVVQLFLKERDREHATDFRAYSNASGDFWLDGLKVVAAIKANQKGFLPPHTYLICEREEGEEDHYTQTLKITKALIEWVLQQPDKDDHYFHWSG